MSSGFSLRSLRSARPDDSPKGADVGREAVRRLRGWHDATVRWAHKRGWRRILRDAALGGAGLSALYIGILWFTLPDISDARSLIAAQSSVIVDRSGTELYRLYREEDRTFIPKERIPDSVRSAIIAIEDERFYERGCLDIQAIARVFLRFGQAGGASTLTRQLARNALDLKRENLLNRKIKELILGCQLEARYSKEELLNLYLNWIPFGQNAYGVEQASQTYFGIAAKDLTLAQAAVLSALPQRPSYFSPFGRNIRTRVSDRALQGIRAGTITKASDLRDDDVHIGLLGAQVGTGATTFYVGGRSDQVLRKMEDAESITEAERLQALEELETMTFKRARENIRAPHFVLWVKRQVEETIATGAEEGILDQGGLTIETTLDWNVQQAAEQVIAARRKDLARYDIHNAALVAADPKTGEILAYVGNADYADDEHDGKVDMARAPRQPGSSFKPFMYAATFERGYGPATVLYDAPTKIGDDEPQNFDGTFMGLLSIRKALGASRNVPAAKAFFLAGGESTVLEMAHRLGAKTPLLTKTRRREEEPDFEFGWPLALGAAETPLLEMVQGYATFASSGTFRPLRALRRIKDRRGNIIFEAQRVEEEVQALDPRIAFEITSVLSDAAVRPNEYWQTILSLPGTQAAAKTGTSNKCLERPSTSSGQAAPGKLGRCTKRKPSDLWTLGYTPSLVAGVWVGNADASPLADKAESLTNAAPIWKEFMTKALRLNPGAPSAFPVPSGIVQPLVSRLSGELPTECTPVEWRAGEVFLEERAPSKPDPACVTLEIDRVTGLLASDECPAEARETKSFLVAQEILADRFPQWQQAALAWAQTESGAARLPLPLAPKESCTLALTPGRLEKPRVFLAFPRDGDTVSYPSFRPRIDLRVGSSVREVRYVLDGKLVATLASGALLETPLRVPRSIKEGGSHTIRVTIVDQYFNTATAESSFRFEEDTTAPVLRFLRPTDGATIENGVKLDVEVEVEDREGGIKDVEFYLGERLLVRRPKEPYAFTYDANLKSGTYVIRAVATDLAGNTAEEQVTVTVEP